MCDEGSSFTAKTNPGYPNYRHEYHGAHYTMNEPTLIGALALRAGAKISTRTDIGVVFQVQERRHAAI